MIFNPLTKEIYTNNGEFIKTMYCPYNMSWDKLEIINSNMRKCTNCDHSILDTVELSDESLLKIVRQKPSTCLKIDLNQNNLKIISNGNFEQK